jgi:hypothetical protein
MPQFARHCALDVRDDGRRLVLDLVVVNPETGNSLSHPMPTKRRTLFE